VDLKFAQLTQLGAHSKTLEFGKGEGLRRLPRLTSWRIANYRVVGRSLSSILGTDRAILMAQPQPAAAAPYQPAAALPYQAAPQVLSRSNRKFKLDLCTPIRRSSKIFCACVRLHLITFEIPIQSRTTISSLANHD
jgi:hypothetical protein